MRPESIVILAIFALFALAEARRHGFLSKPAQRRKDLPVELIGGGILLLITQPTVLFTSAWLGYQLAPQWAGALAATPLLGQIALLLLCDDLMQYTWHRLSHSLPWLYKLHRAHHDAPYMSVRIMYRNNLFYYALMPSLWLSGGLIFLGLGEVYAVYIAIKLSVVAGAHSDVCWDAPLRRHPRLAAPMWLLTRIMSTPLTHHAHHGQHLGDGATHYKGNYGNLLFVWDVLFGTAKIADHLPASYGVENLHEAGAAEQLLWPLVPSTESAPSRTDPRLSRS